MAKKIILLLLLFMTTTAYASDIKMDGDFSDWIDKPSILAEEPEALQEGGTSLDGQATAPTTAPDIGPDTAEVLPDGQTPAADLSADAQISDQAAAGEKSQGPKYKISQLKWSVDKKEGFLYLMVRLSHGNYADNMAINTEIISDYGEFHITTDYDLNDGTVFSRINGTNITTNEGSCSAVNKQTTYLEYAIPLDALIEDMQWGYLLKLKVHTEDDTAPKKDYLVISTASSGPVAGAVIVFLFGIGGFYLFRKKRVKI